MPLTTNVFPSQKKSIREKTTRFLKDCVDAGVALVDYNSNSGLRASMEEKRINLDLTNNILDAKDVERVVNPWKMKGVDFPVTMRNYPLSKPKIDLLVGEEVKRRFDWRVVIKNDDAISDKEKIIMEQYLKLMGDQIVSKNYDPQKAQAELQKLEQWRLYEAQDVRERMATQILSILWRSEGLQHKFNRGFEDLLITGEEIYSIQIVGGEPRVEKENPLNIHTVRSGESIFIEDSDIIIRDSYLPIGKVTDDYYEYLSSSDISDIEEGNNTVRKAKSIYPMSQDYSIPDNYYTEAFGQTIVMPSINAIKSFGGWYDQDGNIRVTQVLWKSRRKLGKRTYYDEQGELQEEFVDEFYPVNKDLGEEVSWIWVNEWWEGTKIGKDNYVKMQPLPRIGLSMSNPSRCIPPIVGSIYNISSNKAMSMMSYLKPYQYLYDAIMYNTELAITKNRGKIGWVPIHLIPDEWDMDTWFAYFNLMNVAVIDMFKEGKKGAATGKLSGNMQAMPAPMDLEMGNYIQTNIAMLQLIRQHTDEISGVSPQRQGQIDTRELVGSTERAITQSSHITEKLFFLHDTTKLRVMEALLETAKYAWRNKGSIKKQYVMDDMTTMMLNADGEQFATAEYGLFISNSSADMELMSALKSLAQAGLQNDKLNFSDIMTIYMSDSISSIRRKIQASEATRTKAQQEQFQAEQQAKAMEIQTKADSEQKDRDLKWDIAELQADTELEIAGMQPTSQEPIVPDNSLEVQKQEDKTTLERDKLEHTKQVDNTKLRQKDAEIAIKRRVSNRPITKK